jgi:hypothetical protein
MYKLLYEVTTQINSLKKGYFVRRQSDSEGGVIGLRSINQMSTFCETDLQGTFAEDRRSF